MVCVWKYNILINLIELKNQIKGWKAVCSPTFFFQANKRTNHLKIILMVFSFHWTHISRFVFDVQEDFHHFFCDVHHQWTSEFRFNISSFQCFAVLNDFLSKLQQLVSNIFEKVVKTWEYSDITLKRKKLYFFFAICPDTTMFHTFE
jgi:hypothetical protein